PQRYHGHMTIELRNARSGSRDRVEHDNEFTVGIENYLQSCGYFRNSPWDSDDWTNVAIHRNLIGGILLFDREINKVNGAYPTIMPAGTKMVANGSYGVTNNGNPTELGSFNSSESSFTENALTYVYDWPTQTTGTIACASLTSDTGGYIGYGNSVSNASAALKLLDEKQTSGRALNPGAYGAILTATIKNNVLYYISDRSYYGNISNFTLSRRVLPVDAVNLFAASVTTQTVSIPTTITNGTSGYIIYACGEGKLMVLPYGITTNVSYTVGIYDIEADNWEYHTFTSDKTISSSTQYSYASAWETGFFAGGLFVDWANNEVSTSSAIAGLSETPVHPISDDLYLVAVGSSNQIKVYDAKNDTLYNTNGRLNNSPIVLQKNANNQLLRTYNNSGIASLYMMRNPLFLATVNNLDEPVQKGSSQTMKVTYTVTPA
ncbi:MAG: hypothetical protein IJ794_20230, partial [Lachnospiraceae bacterium]|nr:hypothetical protein [Lachnospiraceae bacterium]